ncbi:hypothetical protein BGZ98_010067 [Dissophora globulifera]|nr:hypothetical protein BGZ98_010067 [Dissophora globulifera]
MVVYFEISVSAAYWYNTVDDIETSSNNSQDGEYEVIQDGVQGNVLGGVEDVDGVVVANGADGADDADDMQDDLPRGEMQQLRRNIQLAKRTSLFVEVLYYLASPQQHRLYQESCIKAYGEKEIKRTNTGDLISRMRGIFGTLLNNIVLPIEIPPPKVDDEAVLRAIRLRLNNQKNAASEEPRVLPRKIRIAFETL